MAQTLWERITKGKEVVEFNYTNPAKAKIGGVFNLDVLGLRDKMFTLREIIEYQRNINGKQCNFCDYMLTARSVGSDDVNVRVRFMPLENPDAMQTHTVVVLEQYDRMKFNQQLDDALRDTTGELVITDNDSGAEEKYWRINDAKTPYNVKLNIVKDLNNDGTVQADEVEQRDVEYWDFHRNTQDEAGQEFTQYLFVEKDDDDGVQTMWRGTEVDPQRVTML